MINKIFKKCRCFLSTVVLVGDPYAHMVASFITRYFFDKICQKCIVKQKTITNTT
jgi:hypothetical protein